MTERQFCLEKGMRMAVPCRGGPSNLFFAAGVVDTLLEGFELNGYTETPDFFAVSGPCPVALMGCIRETKKLCAILRNLKPEEIVGNMRELKSISRFLKHFDSLLGLIPHKSDLEDLKNIRNLMQKLKEGHVIENKILYQLIAKHGLPLLERVFSPEASLMKIGAVDSLTGQQVIFSNKVPEHKDPLFKGIVGSMGLVPQFPDVTIDRPIELKLTSRTHPEFDLLRLIDGGYRAGLLLEEAIREQPGYDIMFIVDIEGIQILDWDTRVPVNFLTRILRAQSLRSTAHDQLLLSIQDRIDEEIKLRGEFQEIKTALETMNSSRDGKRPIVKKIGEWMRVSENFSQADKDSVVKKMEELIDRMNYGRLRLHDKHAPKRYMISNPGAVVPFDFTNYTQDQPVHLMQAGHDAALNTLRELGLSTKGIPLVRP